MQRARAGYRVDTGPVQFDDDWPGYFFRGDDLPIGILALAITCLDTTDYQDLVVENGLRDLIEELRTCQANHQPV